jgi:hypothetical protein
MPRRSNPQNQNHPLKLLREICGLSQVAFARTTGIPLDTLRSLESYRRAQGEIPDEILSRISLSIGAMWNYPQKQWFFVLGLKNMDPNEEWVLYQREHFEGFRQQLAAEAQDRDVVVYYFLHELLSFCEAIPAKSFNSWVRRLEHFFQQARKEVSWPATPQTWIPIWDRKKLRVSGYRMLPYGLLTGEELKFGDLIRRAREQIEKLQARVDADADWQESVQSAQATQKPKKAPRSRRSSAARSKNTSAPLPKAPPSGNDDEASPS